MPVAKLIGLGPRMNSGVFPRWIWLAILASFCLLLPASAVHADELGDGKKALKNGDADAAIQYLQVAVQKDPDRSEAFRYYGLALELKGLYEEALPAFDRAAQLDERSSEAQRGRGAALAKTGQPDAAVEAYRAAMRLDSKYPRAALELGYLLVELERYDEAVEVFALGTKWGRDVKPYFYEGLGKAEAARGNMKDAELNILNAREMQPDNPQFHVALGDLYFDRNIPSLAIISYQQAIDIDPADVPARFAMATALAKEARYNEALDQYKEVIGRDPDYAPAYLEMGTLYLRASDANRAFLEDAIDALEAYQELGGTEPIGTINLARAYYKRKRGEEAKALLDPIAASGEMTEEGYLVYGRIHYEMREFEGAALHFGAAGSKLERTDFRRWAHALRESKRYDEADAIYLARWDADSTSGEPIDKASDWLLESGKMHYRQGRANKDTVEYEVAILRFVRKIELDPASPDAYYYMGLSLRQLNRFEDSIGPLEKAAELAPQKADRHFWLGVTYNKVDQKDMAGQKFQETAALDDSTVIGAISRQQLGYILLLEKDYAGAIEVLEESSEIAPEQVQTWVWLGQAYQNSGQRSPAEGAYRKALELDSNQADAKKGLAQLSG